MPPIENEELNLSALPNKITAGKMDLWAPDWSKDKELDGY